MFLLDRLERYLITPFQERFVDILFELSTVDEDNRVMEEYLWH